MRHVDDAHQAIGDGQAQRHQQQNRAQADTGEHHAQTLAPGQCVLDRGKRGDDLGFDFGVGFNAELLVKEQLRFRAFRLPQCLGCL